MKAKYLLTILIIASFFSSCNDEDRHPFEGKWSVTVNSVDAEFRMTPVKRNGNLDYDISNIVVDGEQWSGSNVFQVGDGLIRLIFIYKGTGRGPDSASFTFLNIHAKGESALIETIKLYNTDATVSLDNVVMKRH